MKAKLRPTWTVRPAPSLLERIGGVWGALLVVWVLGVVFGIFVGRERVFSSAGHVVFEGGAVALLSVMMVAFLASLVAGGWAVVMWVAEKLGFGQEVVEEEETVSFHGESFSGRTLVTVRLSANGRTTLDVHRGTHRLHDQEIEAEPE